MFIEVIHMHRTQLLNLMMSVVAKLIFQQQRYQDSKLRTIKDLENSSSLMQAEH